MALHLQLAHVHMKEYIYYNYIFNYYHYHSFKHWYTSLLLAQNYTSRKYQIIYKSRRIMCSIFSSTEISAWMISITHTLTMRGKVLLLHSAATYLPKLLHWMDMGINMTWSATIYNSFSAAIALFSSWTCAWNTHTEQTSLYRMPATTKPQDTNRQDVHGISASVTKQL